VGKYATYSFWMDCQQSGRNLHVSHQRCITGMCLLFKLRQLSLMHSASEALSQ
jgi:hypothetical protein